MTTGMMVAEAEMWAPAAGIEAGVQASNSGAVDLREADKAAALAPAGHRAGARTGAGLVIHSLKAGTAVPTASAGPQVRPLLLLAQGLQTATCQRISGMAGSSGPGNPSKGPHVCSEG